MKALKYAAGALAVSLTLAITFVAFAQSKKSAGQSAKPAPTKQTRKTVKPTATTNLQPAASSRVMGAISALPMTPEGKAEEDAAFAPSDAFYQQAKTLYASGDLTGAEAACLNALNHPPVIQGRKFHVPFVADLLGQVYLKDGQYQKAVYWLQGARQTTSDSSLNFNLALAYLKLGDYQNARRHFSLPMAAKCLPSENDYSLKDLPGVDTPEALEASILMARGLDASTECRFDDALADLQAAHQLAPDNALLAYHCADILHTRDYFAPRPSSAKPNFHDSEETSLYEIAAAKGHGSIAQEAKDLVENGRLALAYRAAHPERFPQH